MFFSKRKQISVEQAKGVFNCYYLFHSGFAVETERHWLIFDYYLDIPGEVFLQDEKLVVNNTPGMAKSLDNGCIDPVMFGKKNVFVFVSHSHSDHLNEVVFSWKSPSNNIRYIVSEETADILGGKYEVSVFREREARKVGDVGIGTLRSTDLGVAFFVEVDGRRIYHAGDHGNWVKPLPERQRQVEAYYTAEIKRLENYGDIDLAFVPVVALTGNFAFALDSLMRNLNVRNVVPMHFSSSHGYDVFNKLDQLDETKKYRDRIVRFSKRGEKLRLRYI
jgi:L-ascorbate metabolism protein UlaG (beta-lactamase superfamily)